MTPWIAGIVLLAGAVPALAEAVAAPPLGPEQVHSSGAFAYRLPEGWHPRDTGRPEVLEAWGRELGVRFFYQRGESGFDSLHVACMLEQMAPAMETEPRIAYEYDHLGGMVGGHQVLDSAFLLRFDKPLRGHQEWRQRTVTIVGGGTSLCIMTYAPAKVWKKSKEARAALDAVVTSVVLK